MKRLTRKQPRRLTPPLLLRDPADGSRQIIEVDDSITTATLQHSGRTTAFLTLGPGLTIRVRSKCINKRRVTWLVVAPAAPADCLDGQ